jgi:alkylation response protein AidB-like acyl-CoA dehydrogenase
MATHNPQSGAPLAAAIMSDRLDPLVCGLAAEEAELVSAASSLVPVLSANADKADVTRRLPEEDRTALREAGLFRLATPRAYGGHEAGAHAATAIAAELPGTSRVAHLEDNIAAARINLSDDEYDALETAVRTPASPQGRPAK